MIVLDASVVVELLLGGERAEAVLPRIEAEEGEMHAAGLLDADVAQAFRRLERAGVVEPRRARAAIEILQDLPVERHPERPLLPRMWELRANLTAYDAAYVALAEAIGCPLLTFDSAIAESPGLAADVELPG